MSHGTREVTRCKLCKVVFGTRKSARNHIRTVHRISAKDRADALMIRLMEKPMLENKHLGATD